MAVIDFYADLLRREAEQAGDEFVAPILHLCPHYTDIPMYCGCAPGECAETDNAAWRRAMI